MPTSGCSTSMPVTRVTSPAVTVRPGTRSSSRPAASSQATTTANAGLTNSDGCNDSPPTRIQRLAPLTSAPTTRVAAVSASAPASTITAVRRTPFGVSIEAASMTATAIGR